MGIFNLFKKECKEIKERKTDYLLSKLESINNVCKDIASIKTKFSNIGRIRDFAYESIGEISPTAFVHFTVFDEAFIYVVDVEIQSMNSQLTGININRIPVNSSINEYEKEHLVFKISYQDENQVEIYPYFNDNFKPQIIRDTLETIYNYLVETKIIISSSSVSHKKEVEKLRFNKYLTK